MSTSTAEAREGGGTPSGFRVDVRFDGSAHVVAMSGELDLMSRAAALDACVSPSHRHVVVDLADLVFMDSAGYRALEEATSTLVERGGSMTLVNVVGEPRRLLDLIATSERTRGAPARSTHPARALRGST